MSSRSDPSPSRPIDRHHRHLIARYLRPHRRRMALLGGILALTIGIRIATPVLIAHFIDRAIAGGTTDELITLALLTLLLTVVGQGLAVAETAAAESVSWDATNALRIDLAAHVLRLDATVHTTHTPGEMIERIDGDVSTLARFLSTFIVTVVGNGLLLVGVVAVLVATDWRVGAIVAAMLAITTVVMLRIRASAEPLWRAEREASAEHYGDLGEHLGGLEDLRSSRAEAFVLRRMAARTQRWFAVSKRAQMRGYALVATSDGLFGLGLAAALGASVLLFAQGELTLGAVFLVFRFTDMVREPADRIRQEVQDLQQADASIGRIARLLSQRPVITDGPGAALPDGPLTVELDGVTFGYRPDRPVLHGVTVTVPAGRVLGVVGRTGSGKTSLTRLLPRLLDVTEGAVRLGGIDVRDVRLDAVRSRIGTIPQDVQVLHASVRDNLTLFDATVPDDRLQSALTEMGLGAWLRDLSQGLDTPLGGDAAPLSAGQAQLLACTRILLYDPDIVILDEPSSRLDPATARRVHAALARLLAGRTGIVVTHRVSTLDLTDDILVLEGGCVIEHGPRAELAADPDSHLSRLLLAATEVAR